jgi:hypothetical protein
MCNIQNKLKNVYYYNSTLWYQIKSEDKLTLINKNGNLKNFIVLDITKDKIYTKDEFVQKHFEKNITNLDVVYLLDSLRYKVYKKIKLKD